MNRSPSGSFVHGISQARIWSGLPFPSAGDFPNTRIKLASPALVGRFFATEPREKPVIKIIEHLLYVDS